MIPGTRVRVKEARKDSIFSGRIGIVISFNGPAWDVWVQFDIPVMGGDSVFGFAENELEEIV